MNEADYSCCGQVRTTPFCPSCGRKLTGATDPGVSLLAHVRARRAQMETAAENAVAEGGVHFWGTAEDLAGRAEKWKAWEAWILRKL